MDHSSSALSEKERLSEIATAARGDTGSRTGVIDSSLLLVRLAARLDEPINDVALRLTHDTVRRTKYPVVEEADGEKTVYRHNLGITDR